MLLFLDFDGVLHSVPAGERGIFCHLERFESVLRDFPHAQVVISSSWRETYPPDVITGIFSADIQSRIIGMTPVSEIRDAGGTHGVRYREIQSYLAGSGADWLALDDDASLFPPGCAKLILCEDGFQETEERALRTALSRFSWRKK